jgi:hypothetical protein
VRDPFYKAVDLPSISNKQGRGRGVISQEFIEYFRPDSYENVKERIGAMLKNIMEFRDDLYLSRAPYKVAYMPPGALFDPRLMVTWSEECSDKIYLEESPARGIIPCEDLHVVSVSSSHVISLS